MAKHYGYVDVTRNGKTFKRRQLLGSDEEKAKEYIKQFKKKKLEETKGESEKIKRYAKKDDDKTFDKEAERQKLEAEMKARDSKQENNDKAKAYLDKKKEEKNTISAHLIKRPTSYTFEDNPIGIMLNEKELKTGDKVDIPDHKYCFINSYNKKTDIMTLYTDGNPLIGRKIKLENASSVIKKLNEKKKGSY